MNPSVWSGVIADVTEWTCGNTKKIRAGDRLFLIRLGAEPRGIVASGQSLTDVFEDEEGTRLVRMKIDTFLDADCEDILPRARLDALNIGAARPMKWSAQISGTQIPDPIAERLEAEWRAFLAGRSPSGDEVHQSDLFYEGGVRQSTVSVYERNTDARRCCIERHGRVCSVCGITCEAIYGIQGEGFIHVHHLKPLAEIGEEYRVDPINDLRPVCPNCHAVIHLGGATRSIDEVRRMLATARLTVANPSG